MFRKFEHFILAATPNSSLCSELMGDTEENESSRRKTCTCATLAIINPIRTLWNVSLALRGDRPATMAHAISILQKPNQKKSEATVDPAEFLFRRQDFKEGRR